MGCKTINYNLGGMDCSASLVAIDLAKQVCYFVVILLLFCCYSLC